ncbi:MAG TPA: hypothetical protein PLK37_16830 [Terricaulis sp.]|nr:hypothetical protein [Terricaulis sp.]
MRKLVAAAVCVLALGAAGAVQAQEQPGWSYAYVEGVATATQRDDRGRVTATFTCRPPTGDIVVTDYSFSQQRLRRVTSAGVTLGNLTVNVPASVEGRGRQARLVINLPQRPPILAGAQERDIVTVTVNNEARAYQAGSAMRLKEVAYACWGG